MAFEFFINAVRGGYRLEVDGLAIGGTFPSKEAAADLAVRFAQDNDAATYRIFY